MANLNRTAQDYAIEHAGYLADAAKAFMESVQAVAIARQQHDDAEPGAEAAEAYDVMHGQEELLSERWSGLRTAVYEFEKRRDRAKAPEVPPETICVACDGTGWCEGSPAFTCERCKGAGKLHAEGQENGESSAPPVAGNQ